MSKLCKPVPAQDRRTPFIKMRVSLAERLEIEEQARLRNLNVSEYLRRVALHRRADVQIETEMILELQKTVAAIRALHAGYLQQGLAPPENILGSVITNAIQAILNVARY